MRVAPRGTRRWDDELGQSVTDERESMQSREGSASAADFAHAALSRPSACCEECHEERTV